MVYNYLLLFDGWVAVKLICYPFSFTYLLLIPLFLPYFLDQMIFP
nr:MAG TPA: hypothetical protein [Herelleviridae sp.]